MAHFVTLKSGVTKWAFFVAYMDKLSQIPNNIRRILAELFKPDDDATRTGLMVGIWLEEETAANLALPNGEPAESLHITLAYCGDVHQLADATIARVISQAEYIARDHAPMSGRIGGIGRFDASSQSNGVDVIYAVADVPGLSKMRERLAQHLTDIDCPPKDDHGFTPHITLAYVEPGAAAPVDELPPLPLRITELTVCVGDKKTSFPLVGPRYESPSFYSMCAENGATRLFNHYVFATPPEWIPYLPIPNTYTHPLYGEIEITVERNGRFADQFNNGIYQEKIAVDAEHETKLSGAVGWIDRMRQNADGSVDARVEWTDRGVALIESDGFKYFSPEWYDEWCDPASGECYQDVAVGGAITTRPFFKENALRPLVASEGRITADLGDDMSEETVSAQQFTELQSQFSELQTQLGELKAENAALKATEQAATEQAKTLSERVAAMETDARRKRFAELAADWYAPEGVSHVTILETMADSFGEDADAFKAYVTQQISMAEMISMNELFREHGTNSQSNGSTAEGKLEAAAKKLMEADAKLTYAQAYSEAVQRNPELYRQYTEEAA